MRSQFTPAEEVYIEIDAHGMRIEHKNLENEYNGLCICRRNRKTRIIMEKRLGSGRKEYRVAAEEYMHGLHDYDDILDQDKPQNRKLEQHIKRETYQYMVPIDDIVQALKEKHANSFYEMAEFLYVTEDDLCDILELYEAVHGVWLKCGDVYLRFRPLYLFTKD